MDLAEYLDRGGEVYLPNLSIDIVIMGYQDNVLKCLLLRIGEKWLLPGGYIGREESVENATTRILRDRTSLQDPHFEFLSVIGHADRQFREEIKGFIEQSGHPWREDYWFNDRFISLAYYSLVNIRDTNPIPGVFDQAVAWFPMDELPDMWMDHKAIALKARARLRQDIRKDPIAHKLLPSPFTMPELHRLHQAILGEQIDRSRFQKKMLATGLFERLPRLLKETPGQNPYQYILKKS